MMINMYPSSNLDFVQRVYAAVKDIVPAPDSDMRIDTISFFFYDREDTGIAIRYDDDFEGLTFILEGDEVK